MRNPESSAGTNEVSVRARKEGTQKERTRDDDGRAGLERLEVVLEPGDVEDIEMVGRLIEEENIGLFAYVRVSSHSQTRPQRDSPRREWRERAQASSSILQRGIRWRPPGDQE